MSKRFRLGEQPDWAGTEDAVQPPPGFIDLLLPPGHADVDAGADLSRAVQSLLERVSKVGSLEVVLYAHVLPLLAVSFACH